MVSKALIEKTFDKVMESQGKMGVSTAMREVGYPATTARNPQGITRSKTWQRLVSQRLSDNKLTEVHSGLLNSNTLDHMVFPLGPKEEEKKKSTNEEEKQKERTTLTDNEIKEFLLEVNCKVRRIVHGDTARHVYFWAPDNKTRKEALDMAYKLKGKYPANGGAGLIVPIQINFRDAECQS